MERNGTGLGNESFGVKEEVAGQGKVGRLWDRGLWGRNGDRRNGRFRVS